MNIFNVKSAKPTIYGEGRERERVYPGLRDVPEEERQTADSGVEPICEDRSAQRVGSSERRLALRAGRLHREKSLFDRTQGSRPVHPHARRQQKKWLSQE